MCPSAGPYLHGRHNLRPSGSSSVHVGHSQWVALPARSWTVSSGRSASISTPSSSKWMWRKARTAA